MTGHRRGWALVLSGVALLVLADSTAAQQRPAVTQRGVPPAEAVEDWLIQWPLPAGAERYRDLDGKRMHAYVMDQALISRRYRDQINAQYWGRIIGRESDAESAQWLSGKFTAAGLSDVRIQKFPLIEQWYPKSFRVTVTTGGRTTELASAQPFYRSPGTPAAGLNNLEAVYVGLGAASDFIGRDVRGKAVFIYRLTPGTPDLGGRVRAEQLGAAAIFDVHMLPGNIKYQAYPGGDRSANAATVPSFSVGNDDGLMVQEMIAAASAGQPVRVNVNLEIEMTTGLETALVWGTLPGATDETIYIMAHRDGWFDSGSDNAAGVAVMIGMAEHYAKIPQSQRRRTMVFIGSDGHHNSGPGSGPGLAWLGDPVRRQELFGKTALFINSEHPAAMQTTVRARYVNNESVNQIFWTNAPIGQQWYAGGPTRPALQALAQDAFKEFGVTTYFDPNPSPPAGECSRFSQFVPCLATSEFYHYFQSEHETPETVPWTGLESVARAYSRIVDRVNQMDLSDLQRPATN
jgi:hypothetical protein